MISGLRLACSRISRIWRVSFLEYNYHFSSNLIYGDSTRQVPVWKVNPITQWHTFITQFLTAHRQFIPIINNNSLPYYWQFITLTTVNLSQLLTAIYHIITGNLSHLLPSIYHSYWWHIYHRGMVPVWMINSIMQWHTILYHNY